MSRVSIILVVACAALCSCSTPESTAFAGWSNGNAGVDRPGNDYNVTVCDHTREQAAAQACCFNICMSDDACAAWSYEFDNGKCHLKDATPPQAVSHGADRQPLFASGVKHAAQSGLLPLQYTNFKLGTIKTSGWLRTQLVLMTNGLSGHLELFWDDIADSVWVGGQHDHSGAGHERGPYWLNGVVPLAAHLNASSDSKATTLNVDLQAPLVE